MPREDLFAPGHVAREHRRAEPVLRVVHRGARLRSPPTRASPMTGPKDSSRITASVVDVDQHRRREPVAGPVDPITAAQHLAHRAVASSICAASTSSCPARRAGRLRPSSLGIADPVAARPSSTNASTNRPRWPRARRRARSRCTIARCCRTRLRRRRAAASSTSTSSHTYAASLPPSSSCTRTSRSAAADGDALARSCTSR